MLRFLRKALIHPGTWVFFALLAVGMGILFPLSAPALMIFAAVSIGLATIATVFYLGFNIYKYLSDESLHHQPKYLSYCNKLTNNNIDDISVGKDIQATLLTIRSWAKHHKAQAFIVTVGIGLFITALVLTIGFFTGGAAFAFMAPVFAAITAPFAAAAASAGLQLCLAALAGATLVLASLNVTNLLKRFAQWVDSFKWDYVAKESNYQNLEHETNKKNELEHYVYSDDNGVGYFPAIFYGAINTVKNGFSSPYEDKVEEYRLTNN